MYPSLSRPASFLDRSHTFEMFGELRTALSGVRVALAVFDPLAQMGPQSGQLGEANESLTDAVGTLPLAVGGIGVVIVVIGSLRALAE